MRSERFERGRRNQHCRAWGARRVLIEPFSGPLVVGRIYAYQMWSNRLDVSPTVEQANGAPRLEQKCARQVLDLRRIA